MKEGRGRVHKIHRLLQTTYLLLFNGNLTGEQIARILNVSLRTAQRYVKQLDQLGFAISSRTGGYRGGYRLNIPENKKNELLSLLYQKDYPYDKV